MTLSDSLLATLGLPDFWAGWYGLGDEVAIGPDRVIEVTTGDAQLVLDLDAADLGLERAGIWFRVGNRFGIDRGDRHALRWDEVEWIGRAIALRGGPPHPGAMLALFGRFAPLCGGDDRWVARLRAALAGAGAPSHLIGRMVSELDARRDRVAWSRDAEGWHLAGPQGVVFTTRRTSVVSAPDRISLLRDGVGAGWIERAELRRRIDGFFEQLARECAAVIEPAWRTPRVRELAAAFASGDHGAAGVLADALHEAGCQHREILAALRDPPESAAWVIDLVAG